MTVITTPTTVYHQGERKAGGRMETTYASENWSHNLIRAYKNRTIPTPANGRRGETE
jgi:hypothetical protein